MKQGLIFAFCLIFIFTTFAQAADPGPPQSFAKNASKEYKNKMEMASAKLKKMEDRLDKIEKTQGFMKNDLEGMSADLDGYGEDMWNLYNEAVNRVKAADETKGKSGGVEEFLYFEDEAQVHAKRMQALDAKHQKIEDGIKNGKVKPGKDVVDTMTPQEKKEYINSLTPEGKKEIEKAYPNMKSSSSIKDFPFASLNGQKDILETLSINGICSDASRIITNFFISPADASVASNCYDICGSVVLTTVVGAAACAVCVIGAGGDAYSAYQTWKRNMSSCSCSWYRAWCCAKKTYWTAVFLAKLA